MNKHTTADKEKFRINIQYVGIKSKFATRFRLNL